MKHDKLVKNELARLEKAIGQIFSQTSAAPSSMGNIDALLGRLHFWLGFIFVGRNEELNRNTEEKDLLYFVLSCLIILATVLATPLLYVPTARVELLDVVAFAFKPWICVQVFIYFLFYRKSLWRAKKQYLYPSLPSKGGQSVSDNIELLKSHYLGDKSVLAQRITSIRKKTERLQEIVSFLRLRSADDATAAHALTQLEGDLEAMKAAYDQLVSKKNAIQALFDETGQRLASLISDIERTNNTKSLIIEAHSITTSLSDDIAAVDLQLDQLLIGFTESVTALIDEVKQHKLTESLHAAAHAVGEGSDFDINKLEDLVTTAVDS